MKTHLISTNRRSSITFLAAVILLPGCLLFAQATPPLGQPGKYTGRVITGDLVKQATVNMTQLASAPVEPTSKTGTEIHPNRRPLLRPPLRESGAAIERAPAAFPFGKCAPGLIGLDERSRVSFHILKNN